MIEKPSRVVFFLCVAAWLAACRGECGNEAVKSVPSPYGKRVATLVRRSCGATSDFSELVLIRPAESRGEPLDDVEDAVFAMRGRDQVDVFWSGNDEVTIVRPDSSADITKHLDQAGTTAIVYKTPLDLVPR
ncbi:MAG TPA: hypothetical protein VMR31_05630 [Myxococcota bacterium]|nr:hypothetical protein [Myxococcota bacterium]